MSDEYWMTEQQAKQEFMYQTNSAHQQLNDAVLGDIGRAQAQMQTRVQGRTGQGQQVRDKAPMEQSVAQAHAALEALGKLVDELLEHIVPICQPKGPPAPSGLENGATNQIETTPSPLRAEFLKLRAHTEAISARISAIRYTIEV